MVDVEESVMNVTLAVDTEHRSSRIASPCVFSCFELIGGVAALELFEPAEQRFIHVQKVNMLKRFTKKQ